MRARCCARFPKQSHESAINCICGSVAVWMDAEARVRTFRPILAALRIDGVGFRTKVANLAKRQSPPPLAVLNLHWNVVPGRMRQPQPSALRMDNLLSRRAPASEIRAQKSPPSDGDWLIAARPQRKFNPIADEPQRALA